MAIDLSAAVIDAEAMDMSMAHDMHMNGGGFQDGREPFPDVAPQSASGQSPHIRRKSVLPVDPSVLRDLQAHRSMELELASGRDM